jgi:hypothetical protein
VPPATRQFSFPGIILRAGLKSWLARNMLPVESA